MRIGNEPYFLFGDHLGSTSVVLDASGQIVEKGYYLPWGGTRGDETITSTDYAYTGQMREGDIYYYGARWYDPDIGRFMQADTIVPLQVQGTQAFDRYAYVNNNPLRYTDPSGNRACDDYYGSGCNVIFPQPIIYNISVCGIWDGINCGGINTETPLNPYHNWPGQSVYFDVDEFGTKEGTQQAILSYVGNLPRRSKLRFIGHSAGADSVLLTLGQLLNASSGYLYEIVGVILLDPTLSGGGYMRVGDMMPIVNDLINSGRPSYFVTTTDYPNDPLAPYTWQFLPENDDNHPNYFYYDLRAEERYRGLSHNDLALNTDIADSIWSWMKGK